MQILGSARRDVSFAAKEASRSMVAPCGGDTENIDRAAKLLGSENRRMLMLLLSIEFYEVVDAPSAPAWAGCYGDKEVKQRRSCRHVGVHDQPLAVFSESHSVFIGRSPASRRHAGNQGSEGLEVVQARSANAYGQPCGEDAQVATGLSCRSVFGKAWQTLRLPISGCKTSRREAGVI